MAVELRHEPERHRFVMATPAGEAYVEYRRVGDASPVLDLFYSYVPPPERSGGVGRRLVLQVLDHTREHGFTVIPTCHFVATVLRENPSYHDLVAPARRRADAKDTSKGETP